MVGQGHRPRSRVSLMWRLIKTVDLLITDAMRIRRVDRDGIRRITAWSGSHRLRVEDVVIESALAQGNPKLPVSVYLIFRLQGKGYGHPVARVGLHGSGRRGDTDVDTVTS